MQLITDEQRSQLLANGAAARRDEHDPRPVVRLHAPTVRASWLLTELDPTDPDLAFGLIDLGLGHPELGYVRLSEIDTVSAALGLQIERDGYFTADKPLSAYDVETRCSKDVD